MGINKGISLFLSLLFLPVFLSCLDTIHYGIFVTVFSFVNWVLFFDLGVGQGLRNKLAETIANNEITEAKKYVSTAYIIIFTIFIIAAVLFLLISPFVNWSFVVNPPAELVDQSNKIIILVFTVMCVNFALRLFYSVVLALQMPVVSSYIDLVNQGICLFLVFILSLSPVEDKFFLFAVIMTLIPAIITTFFSIYFFGKKLHHIAPSFSYFDKSKIKGIMTLGGSFFIIQVSGVVLNLSNNVIIANLAGPEQVAQYYSLNKYMSILFMGFTVLITPFWSAVTEAYVKKDISWIRKMVKRYIQLVLFFMLIGMIMIYYSDFAFRIWIKNKIPIDFWLLILIYIYVSIQMIWSIFGSIINGIGKIKFQLVITAFSACLHIPTAIILGKQLGAIGVILSLVIYMFPFVVWGPYQYNLIINGTATGIWNR